MDTNFDIVYSNEKYAESYNKTVDEVARERKYLSTVNGFSLDSSKWFINHMVSNKYPQYFLILNENVIGWCDINPKDVPEYQHVGILGIGILKDYRNKGYGKKLLLKSINHAKEINHLEKIELTVFESNNTALELYKSIGFKIEGKKEKARKIDTVYDNEIIMGLFLA